MTQREDELLEEVESLQKKLDHAQKWMKRQVEESSSDTVDFFEFLHKKQTFSMRLERFFDRIKHIHIFGRKYTLVEIWQKRVEAFIVGAAIILFWRGIWNLADHYLFPNTPNLSAFSSLLIGM